MYWDYYGTKLRLFIDDKIMSIETKMGLYWEYNGTKWELIIFCLEKNFRESCLQIIRQITKIIGKIKKGARLNKGYQKPMLR